MVAKRVLALSARLQFEKGGSAGAVDVEGSIEGQLLMLLELMRLAPDDAASLVQRAMPLIQECGPNPEIFSQIAEEALKCQEYAACVQASKLAVATAGRIARPIPRLWRWFAVAECVHGRAFVLQIDPKKHDKTAQDSLKLDAMRHYVSCVKYAAEVPADSLAVVAAQQYWNAAVSFMSTPSTRKAILPSLEKLVKSLAKIKVTDETPEGVQRLRTKLYVLLFECLADSGRWGDGLDATGQSLKVLPVSCHKDLWDFRIQFMGKNGKDTTAEMLKVKESGAEMVAKVDARPSIPSLEHQSSNPRASVSAPSPQPRPIHHQMRALSLEPSISAPTLRHATAKTQPPSFNLVHPILDPKPLNHRCGRRLRKQQTTSRSNSQHTKRLSSL